MARSISRIACASAAPTFAGVSRTSRQWQPSGIVEAVDLGEVDRVDVAVELRRLRRLLVPDVADPLEEEQREDVGLPVGAIDRAAAQDLGAVPKM